MKLLVDMNLSPSWVPVLERHGFTAVHWSSVGDGRAPDRALLRWARDNGYIVLTNDLDLGAIWQSEPPSPPASFSYAPRTSRRSGSPTS